MKTFLMLFIGMLALASSGIAFALPTNLEDHLVISAPETLKALEYKGFALPNMLLRSATVGMMGNQSLSKIPELQPVLKSLESEMQAYKFVGRKFDPRYLTNSDARFVLVGIVNRADRGYVYNNNCGEIRFVYRLAYRVMDHGAPVFSRLPMTINMVYRSGLASDDPSCTNVAAAWLRTRHDSPASELLRDGPISASYFDYKNLHALELNLQIDRSGAGAAGGFGGRAVYLMKVFEWAGSSFTEAPLENEIDREAFSKDPSLLQELKSWLLDARQLRDIDDGTLLIPKKFLAMRALTISPGGMARSANRPFYGIFNDADFTALTFNGLKQVKSPDAFVRRLNDSTCTGCHQTRAIGGFHFTGIDPFGMYPGNSVALPGSAHFLGDLARRHAIVEAIAGRAGAVDFSRGYSERPQDSRSKSLVGSGLYNGWGAHCATGHDPSFKTWTCAAGLKCKPLLDSSDRTGMGICISNSQSVGDPCEFGKTTNSGFGKDQFTRIGERTVMLQKAMCSPQSQDPGAFTGGFLGGSIRLLSCHEKPGDLPLPAEANCGPLPASRPGFNACIGTKNFDQCLREFSTGVGLRGCDQRNPCRDDYICGESFKRDRGVCVPPYFLFQFRVDGHPKGDLR